MFFTKLLFRVDRVSVVTRFQTLLDRQIPMKLVYKLVHSRNDRVDYDIETMMCHSLCKLQLIENWVIVGHAIRIGIV